MLLTVFPPRRGLLVTRETSRVLPPRRPPPGRRGLGTSDCFGLWFEVLHALYAKGHGLWFEVLPRDGRLHAHGLEAVLGADEPELRCKTCRVADSMPVITPGADVVKATGNGANRLVYLGSDMFYRVQDTADQGGDRAVNLMAFRVMDSKMPVLSQRGGGSGTEGMG